jgi:hypothetical protein
MPQWQEKLPAVLRLFQQVEAEGAYHEDGEQRVEHELAGTGHFQALQHEGLERREAASKRL